MSTIWNAQRGWFVLSNGFSLDNWAIRSELPCSSFVLDYYLSRVCF